MDEKSRAAIKIQSVWRGYLTRCKLFAILVPKASLMCASRASRTQSQVFEDVHTPSPNRTRQNSPRKRLRERYRAYLSACLASGLEPHHPSVESFRSFCAKSIQRTWKRHIDIQVYQYYRDLINFKCKGAPALMLRCINPREAQLLDSASGTHVKFRLAGEKFPPNIYYKIFTHRPIQDLGAYAPRDYTAMSRRKPLASQRHNKGKSPDNEDKSRWYQRWENNGWRLVSDRLLQLALLDPVTFETSRVKKEFKPIGVQRKEDIERKKRRRRAHWMKKLYSGHLDRDTLPRADSEEDIDDLVNWTTSLDYNNYVSDWQSFATTAGSEVKAEDLYPIRTA